MIKLWRRNRTEKKNIKKKHRACSFKLANLKSSKKVTFEQIFEGDEEINLLVSKRKRQKEQKCKSSDVDECLASSGNTEDDSLTRE